MNTYIGTGHRQSYTNATSTDIESGDVVVLEDSIGVAVTDIAAGGGTGEIEVSGEHTLPANNTATWNQGAQLYWDASPGEIVASSSGNTPAGFAVTAKTNPQATHTVLLNGRCGR